MSRYAEQTTVTSDRSRAEVERTLERYGATAFAYGWQGAVASVMFVAHDRRIQFNLPMPDRNTKEFTYTPTGKKRTAEAAAAAYDQAVRQRWRALALVIKAKLEAVSTGIVTFEEEFLAHIVLPSGDTVGRWVEPQLAEIYGRGEMPALLPGLADR